MRCNNDSTISDLKTVSTVIHGFSGFPHKPRFVLPKLSVAGRGHSAYSRFANAVPVPPLSNLRCPAKRDATSVDEQSFPHDCGYCATS